MSLLVVVPGLVGSIVACPPVNVLVVYVFTSSDVEASVSKVLDVLILSLEPSNFLECFTLKWSDNGSVAIVCPVVSTGGD